MIHKLRRKFISVAMLSMFLVLALIVGTLNVANYISMTLQADRLLDILIENNGVFPETFMGRKVEFEDRNPPGSEGFPGSEEKPETEEKSELQEKQNPEEGNGTDNAAFDKPIPPGRDHRKEGRFFSDETPYETRFFSVKYNPFLEQHYTAYTGRIASVSDETAEEYAGTAIRKFQRFAKMSGYYKNYRYALSPDENGGRLVVFLDVSNNLRRFREVLLYSLILSAAGLLAVFVLVWFFSKRVFKPVEESDLKQKRFITDASHELKTPLTIISANVEVLEMESEENEWTKSIRHQVERMTGLVEQMVTLSRLDESAELEKVDFSLSEAFSDTVRAYGPVAEKNGQILQIDAPDGITFHGDEARIRQMIGLLLENATKYATPRKGEEKAVISASLQRNGKKNRIIVRNTLSETTKGNKDSLFERFYRPDESRNSKKGGSGIGLSIVKSIAEAHKGKVRAFSSDDGSIQFEVEL